MTKLLIMMLIAIVSSISYAQQSVAIVFNATVSKVHKPGAFNNVTDALAAAPTMSPTKYYIHVEAGTYVERVVVPENLTNIVLVGDGADTTKIQWNRHHPDYETHETGTLSVEGKGFIAMQMAFENTAGENGHQAAAVVTHADNAAFYKCTFLGYQDTLYARMGLQFFKNCDIYGTVDFIFGDAAAVFQSCNLYARPHKTVTFTAQGKDGSNSEPSGFVIQDCNLTVAPGLGRAGFDVYLGRPWRVFSTVVVMESYLDDVVSPQGWVQWDNIGRTDELTYVEFGNRGGGANTTRRVKWKGFHNVSQPDQVRSYTVAEFIDSDGWLAGTGIPYSPGFMHN